MFDIHELTAAPHLPEPLKSFVTPTRPEALFALLAQGFESNSTIEVRLREGEIFIALTAS